MTTTHATGTPANQRSAVGSTERDLCYPGYAATTIAQIEAAAGLSPGSGSLYRHFPSKQALLAEGVRQQIAAGEELLSFIADPARFATLGRTERLAVIARAGLRRLDQERDLTRLVVRDLARFPDLLAEMGQEEIQPVYRVVATWLAEQAEPPGQPRDWPALAAVLVNATSHYWLLGDIFGEHPAGIDEDRYVAALAELAAGLLDGSHEEDQKP